MSASRFLSALSGDAGYAIQEADGMLLVTDQETNDEFELVVAEDSVSIRQPYAVEELDDAGAAVCLELMSKINNRFTCCKQCFDEERNIVTISDIPGQVASGELIKAMLLQVQFVAHATYPLFAAVLDGAAMPGEEAIDAAFDSPELS
jgi:hypothetical protein